MMGCSIVHWFPFFCQLMSIHVMILLPIHSYWYIYIECRVAFFRVFKYSTCSWVFHLTIWYFVVSLLSQHAMFEKWHKMFDSSQPILPSFVLCFLVLACSVYFLTSLEVVVHDPQILGVLDIGVTSEGFLSPRCINFFKNMLYVL